MSHKIRLYSSLSRKVDDFHSLKEREVKMYACGVTTYDDAHIGHARQAIFFDVLRRYFEHAGYKVNYVRNFTDIDDKIIDRAVKQGVDPLALSEHYVKETSGDLADLKVRPATHEVKVTDHIADIIFFIGVLLKKDVAYKAGGDVLFDITKFPSYGQLSNRKIEEMKENEPSPHKKNPQDFSLWKAAKSGEPSWPSPWGAGRPGWHIECSVLAHIYLGDQIDIHGGGIDLVFPHHENEIAQSESFSGKKFASYWVHNGLVMVDGKKMSKSLGNFVTIKKALENYGVEAIRLAVFSFRYGSPMDFTDSLFREAKLRLYYFYKTLENVRRTAGGSAVSAVSAGNFFKELADTLVRDFDNSMDDDFDTVSFLSALSEAFKKINNLLVSKTFSDKEKRLGAAYFLKTFAKISGVLDILNEEPVEYLGRIKENFLINKFDGKENWINEKISARQRAKADRNFATADAIRRELEERGVAVHDWEETTTWDPIF